MTPQACLKENKYDLRVFLPSQGLSQSGSFTSIQNLPSSKVQQLERKEAAVECQRDRMIQNVISHRASQDLLPAGTSIAMKLTGESSKQLHQARESDRERLRDMVISTYHRGDNQENRCPFAGDKGMNVSGKTRNTKAFQTEASFTTSLPIGYKDDSHKQSLKAQLGQTLREQIRKRDDLQKSDSITRKQ